MMSFKNSEFNDDIDWSVYNKQQDPTPQNVKSYSKGNIDSSFMKGVNTFNRGVEGGIIAPALGFMQGVANIPAGIANTVKHIAESDSFIKELKKRGKYNLPDVPYFDQAPHTIPGEVGEALSLALGSRPLAEKGGEAIEKGVDLAKMGIKKGYDYLNPKTAGKQAENFRSNIGQGTSSQNIEELGKRAEFARNSQQQQALIPKNELYAQEGKSNVYDVNPKGLPEGNLQQTAGMFNPGVKVNENQIKELQKALGQYRKTGNSDDFLSKGEDIFNIGELTPKHADKIEDILSLPTERNSKYFKDKEVKDFYFKNSKVLERHENYQKNSNLANYDKLQSAIKEEMRRIVDKDSPKYRQLELNATNLNSDKENFMQTLPENMQNLENDFRQKYQKYASTYEKGKKGIGSSETLRNLSLGRHDLVTDAQITKVFGHPTEMDKNIIHDMGPSAAKNALYAAMQRVKPGDAEGMANTILDLKRTKGFDNIVTSDMEEWANSMLGYLRKSESIRRNLGNALKIGGTGATALAGGMLGGPVGAGIGAALPWLGKGAKFIAEKVRK